MPKKELRFTKLVEESGKPQAITLWADPHHDRTFMKAVKEHRVVTLKQEPTAKKKDFGRVGFFEEPHVSYLVFPKPLRADPETCVVGIKYDLLDEPKVRDPVSAADLKPPAPKQKARKEGLPPPEPAAPQPEIQKTPKPEPPKQKPEPVEKEYTVLVRRLATLEAPVQVRARNKKQAAERAV